MLLTLLSGFVPREQAKRIKHPVSTGTLSAPLPLPLFIIYCVFFKPAVGQCVNKRKAPAPLIALLVGSNLLNRRFPQGGDMHSLEPFINPSLQQDQCSDSIPIHYIAAVKRSGKWGLRRKPKGILNVEQGKYLTMLDNVANDFVVATSLSQMPGDTCFVQSVVIKAKKDCEAFIIQQDNIQTTKKTYFKTTFKCCSSETLGIHLFRLPSRCC